MAQRSTQKKILIFRSWPDSPRIGLRRRSFFPTEKAKKVELISPHFEADEGWLRDDHLKDPDGLDYDWESALSGRHCNRQRQTDHRIMIQSLCRNRRLSCRTRAFALSVILIAARLTLADESKSSGVLQPPPAGKLYHGVYPGGNSGEEDDITAKDVAAYEQTIGKKVAWVYFSHNWFRGRDFPEATAAWIRDGGAVPFIRLMLRSSVEKNHKENIFTLQAIADGAFDADLKLWGKAARRFGSPLLVEYGTECNGDWFPWNGRWNGGGQTNHFGTPTKPDGPERFVAAYRHIVQTIRSEGATNIVWVFHPDAHDSPNKAWNRFENYYPGDDVVDWIGVSAYGPQTPMETESESLRQMMDSAYARLGRLAPSKPVLVLEYGCTAGNSVAKPADWAQAALDDILANRWPRVIGFSWWNERWENDDNPRHNTTMRVQDTVELANVFRRKFATATNLVERPMFICPHPVDSR